MVTFNPYNRVREARVRKGLSLNQLARLVGSTPQAIWFVEAKGKRRPYSIDLDLLADVLETTVEDLFPTVAA